MDFLKNLITDFIIQLGKVSWVMLFISNSLPKNIKKLFDIKLYPKFIKDNYKWFLLPFSIIILLFSKRNREYLIIGSALVVLAYFAIGVIAKHNQEKLA